MCPHPSISTDPNDQPHQIDPFAPSPFEVKKHTNHSTGFYAAVTVIAWIVAGLYFGLLALRPLPWISSIYTVGLLIACVAGFTVFYMGTGRKYLIRAAVVMGVILVPLALRDARQIALLVVFTTAMIGIGIEPLLVPAYLIFTLCTVVVGVIKWWAKHQRVRTLVLVYTVVTLLMLTFSTCTVSLGRWLITGPIALHSIRLNEQIYLVVRERTSSLGPQLRLYECASPGFPCQRLWEERYDSAEAPSDLRLSADGTAIELLTWDRLVFTYQPESASPP